MVTILVLGQRFAGLEEKVVLSTLFRRFSFRSTQIIDELQLSSDSILRPRTPIQMFVERRQQSQ
jgi:cytochrome P450